MIHSIKLTSEDTACLSFALGIAMGSLSKERAALTPEIKLAIDRFLAQIGAKPYWHEDNDFLRPKGE